MREIAAAEPAAESIKSLIARLESIRQEIRRKAGVCEAIFAELPEQHRSSAENLFHYLALRSEDLRPLQERLLRLGLSSLGRAEPHVLVAIDSVLRNLRVMAGMTGPEDSAVQLSGAFKRYAERLELNTADLLGPLPAARRGRIMVTMPTHAADDFMMIHQLLRRGMDCMRINCAHDEPATWGRMIQQMRYAERVTGKSCRVLMDLRGPKLRTGPMRQMPAVLKIRPVRDAYGQVVRPARIWLTADPAGDGEAKTADACLVLDRDWLADCNPNDRILLRDARKSKRRWRVREVTSRGCWVESKKTTYLVNGTTLRLRGFDRETRVSGLAGRPSVVSLRADDTLLISRSDEPGKPAMHDETGKQLSPGRISLPIPEIYRDVKPGETVCFDDGRITGIVEKRGDTELQVRITHLRKTTEKLACDKGINFPDTRLDLPALSEKDLKDLEFVARHADMIGLSFTNTAADVRALRERLEALGCDDVGIVIKIETRRGFANLPGILIEALRFPACGVMIARGDLAAECGFERLAEIQEEILWVCEAAHVPVIWATQVLEGLAKSGHATRAEITDAAMSQAAECVMLNKGEHVADAVTMLDGILRRMQDHRSKKRSMLRKLRVAADFSAEALVSG